MLKFHRSMRVAVTVPLRGAPHVLPQIAVLGIGWHCPPRCFAVVATAKPANAKLWKVPEGTYKRLRESHKSSFIRGLDSR